jgi:hypothetical protein
MQPSEESSACKAESAPIHELIGEELPEDHDPWKAKEDDNGDAGTQPDSTS